MGRAVGVGVLAVRKGVRYASPLPSDERERGRVPGYVNVPAIVAAAASLRAVRAEAEQENARLHALVERIRTRVPALVPEVEVVGDPVRRSPTSSPSPACTWTARCCSASWTRPGSRSPRAPPAPPPR
ncbi:hypothetical protein ACFQ1I_14395 [Kitasatospora arboriphila]